MRNILLLHLCSDDIPLSLQSLKSYSFITPTSDLISRTKPKHSNSLSPKIESLKLNYVTQNNSNLTHSNSEHADNTRNQLNSVNPNYPNHPNNPNHLDIPNHPKNPKRAIDNEQPDRDKTPDLVVYFSTNVDLFVLENVKSLFPNAGLIFLSPAYSMNLEIEVYKNGFDHFLLTSTPKEVLLAKFDSLLIKLESLKARQIIGLNQNFKSQSERNNKSTNLLNEIPLPIRSEVELFENLQAFVNQNVVCADGINVRLTRIEMHLFLFFIQNQNLPIERNQIKAFVFKNANISFRTIDAHLSKLKKKLPCLKKYLKSIYGKGYMLMSTNSTTFKFSA